MRKDFALFILSHGRPDRVQTVNALEQSNYCGEWYIIIDDEDLTKDKYKGNFGDKVVMFNKQKAIEKTDRGDNLGKRNIVVPARNQSFQIAKSLGLRYFMMLDDDYNGFYYRFTANWNYYSPTERIEDLDYVLNEFINFFEKARADSISFAQGGDFIGGKQSSSAQKLQIKRKTMNTMLCSVNRPFRFFGAINEDVNAYIRLQQLGKLFFQVNSISIGQKGTQNNPDGLTDIYLEEGTYVKSFYTILYSPSCTKLILMGDNYKRIHHEIKWRNAVPKILSEEYKK